MYTDDSLVGKVRFLIASTFGTDESNLPNPLSQSTCKQWTSLNHMLLMVAIEDEFGLRLSLPEMTSMASLEAIVDTLAQHTAAAA